ncbi:type III PLP-dependent enzyme [Streptomyces sp. CA-250714]|uniref:type III PLP-dependent enzyme n=1 Tax=Streptomyces sp. CA-250714 TaxID=3240060 RepID=UPI003D8C9ECE
MTDRSPQPAVPPSIRRRLAGLSGAELPAYLYDLAALRRHAASIRAALPERVELYYAAKANPEAAILAALAPWMDGFEVSSGGELAHVHQAVPQSPLAFGGPGKTPAELGAALETDRVERIHVESEHELHMLGELASRTEGEREVPVLLRANLPVSGRELEGSALAMGGRPTPFGLDPAQLERCLGLLAECRYRRLRLRGIHAHLASGLDAADQVAVAEQIVDRTVELARRHRTVFPERLEVNVGGGMAVDYTDPAARFDWAAYGAGLARILDAHPGLTLRVEPGRAITAYCGWYATEVLDVKPSHGEWFAVVRGGTHHLRTPAAKQHDQPLAVLPVENWPHPWPRPVAECGPITFAGQLCTPKDVLARQVPVARLRPGDLVVFALAGAYAWNISHHDFLMHPRPAFHFLDDSEGPVRHPQVRGDCPTRTASGAQG